MPKQHLLKNKWFVVISATLMMLGVALLLLKYERGGPAIKIGILHSLTGTMVISEKPLVDALQFALEEINAAGGVNGRKIEAVIRDCRSDPDYCAQQAEQLITRGQGQCAVWLLDFRLPQGRQAGGRKTPSSAVLSRAV